MDSRRLCTFSPCLCVCPAPGRSHAWTGPCVSPSAPLSIWPSEVAWLPRARSNGLANSSGAVAAGGVVGNLDVEPCKLFCPVSAQVIAVDMRCRSMRGSLGEVAQDISTWRGLLRGDDAVFERTAGRPVAQAPPQLHRRRSACPCWAAVEGCASGILPCCPWRLSACT